MTLRDIFLPWLALREARGVARRLNTANKRYLALIATGHFRNPKNGRLGKRGQVFYPKVDDAFFRNFVLAYDEPYPKIEKDQS